MGLYRNAEWTDQAHSRGITMFLHVWMFFLLTSTFANMVIAAIESADVAGGIVNLLMILMFAFCGYVAHDFELPSHTANSIKHPCWPDRAPGFLDFHVPRQPIHQRR